MIRCDTVGWPWNSSGCCQIDIWCTSLWSWSQTAALCSRPATDSKADYADSRTVFPRDLSWPHCCSTSTSINDLPDTISKKYGYANDLAILTANREWKKTESTLSQDMSTLALYLRQWRLKLSEGKTVSTVFHLNNKEAKRELHVYIDTRRLNFQPKTTYLGVKLDRTLSYRQNLAGLRDKVMARSALIRKLVGTGWGGSPSTLRTSALALVYAPAEYCAPTWSRSKTHQPTRSEPKLHLKHNHWMLTTNTSRAAPCACRHPISRAS